MKNYTISLVVASGFIFIGCSTEDGAPTMSQDEPQILAMSPAPSQSYIAQDQAFVIEYSMPMDVASVEREFTITNAQQPIVGQFTWSDDATIVFFKPTSPFRPETEIQAHFGPGMRSRRGQTLNGQDGRMMGDFSVSYTTYGYPEAFASNGERIYFTGTSESGQPITFTMEPLEDSPVHNGYWPRASMAWTANEQRHTGWGMYPGMRKHGMMGGETQTGFHGMTCASCHGPDGQGGRYLAMGTVSTPDIRYATLTEVEAEDVEEAEHAHAPYTDQLLHQAISEGLKPDGDPLNSFMPRWSMTDEDWADLLAFIKTL